jgi:hypothetical protein
MLCKIEVFMAVTMKNVRLLGYDVVRIFLRTDVSEERIATNMRIERISLLGTLAVTSNCHVNLAV